MKIANLKLGKVFQKCVNLQKLIILFLTTLNQIQPHNLVQRFKNYLKLFTLLYSIWRIHNT